jgi:Mn2+/Fe2+ NRAMP family transporter
VLTDLGAGIVSGASDNDPTTVATLAVVGSTTTYALSWLVVLIVPMLAVVQSIAARCGAVSKRGLEDAVKERYGRGWALVMVAAVLAVTVLTLAADLEGGAAALGLLTHIDYRWFVLPFAAVSAALLIWGRYRTIAGVLQYVALLFFAYVIAVVAAHPNWAEVARATFLPHWPTSKDEVAGAVALLGTTLTSYAYVWETIEVAHDRPPLARLGLVQVDAVIGTLFAGAIFWCIVICTGATLGTHHHIVSTTEEAARALEPIAGRYASLLFGIGLLASAMLAVPVLAGTSAYVIAEAFGWRASLDARFARARAFYVALVIGIGLATAIAYLGIKPIALLFAASIAGGFGTPVTLTLMLLIARDRRTMKGHHIGGRTLAAGWAVNAIVIAACAMYFVQTLRGG